MPTQSASCNTAPLEQIKDTPSSSEDTIANTAEAVGNHRLETSVVMVAIALVRFVALELPSGTCISLFYRVGVLSRRGPVATLRDFARYIRHTNGR